MSDVPPIVVIAALPQPTGNAPLACRPAAWWQTFAVLGLALVVRGGILGVQFENLNADPDGYREFAEQLLDEGLWYFPSAYRPPLYPILLTNCLTSRVGTLAAIGMLHLFCGLLTVWLTMRLGQKCSLGRWSLLAGGLVACDPILLHHSTLVMTETLATLLAVVSLVALVRASETSSALAVAMASGSLALATLCRPVFLVMLAVCWLPLVLRETTWLRRGGAALAYFVAAAAILGPWVVRNYRVLGQPVLTTTHGGYTFHLGNNARYYESLRENAWGQVWLGEDPIEPTNVKDWLDLQSYIDSPGGLERFWNRWHYRRARLAIEAEPGMFAYACLMRNAYLWQLVPHATDENESSSRRALRYGVGLWYAAVFVLALVGVWSLGRCMFHLPWLWGTLLCGSFMLVHTFYWTNMRMRAPLMPVVALLAAAGAARVYATLNCGRRERTG